MKQSELELRIKERRNVGRLFDLENPFWSFIGKLVDVVWLNLIFLVFSIPIVTIGASTTAMYTVTMKMVRDREGYMFQGFWKAFKANFKQATLLWIGVLIVGTVLGVDVYFFYKSTAFYARWGMALILGIILVAVCMLTYLFPLQAQFENSIKQTLKNALLLSIKHLPWTVLLVLIYVVAAFFLYLIPPLVSLFGFGLVAFLTSYIYTKIFLRYIPEEMRNDY